MILSSPVGRCRPGCQARFSSRGRSHARPGFIDSHRIEFLSRCRAVAEDGQPSFLSRLTEMVTPNSPYSKELSTGRTNASAAESPPGAVRESSKPGSPAEAQSFWESQAQAQSQTQAQSPPQPQAQTQDESPAQTHTQVQTPPESKAQPKSRTPEGAQDEDRSDQPPKADTGVMATFRWHSSCPAESVSVAGTFSNWEPMEMRRLGSSGDFVRSGKVQPGTHQYKFLVDGIWRTSPHEPITKDEHNNPNNIRHIHTTATFSWEGGSSNAKKVYMTGSMTSWSELVPMEEDFHAGGYVLNYNLEPGKHLYRCLVDGKWTASPEDPIEEDTEGNINNVKTVSCPRAFTIFYSTGWTSPVLHFRWTKEDGTPCRDDWYEIPMVNTKSRPISRGSTWKQAQVCADDGVVNEEAPKLEFYVSNGNGKEDRPRGGKSYVCSVFGGYKLQSGRLKPFAKALKGPVMVVSDLDGTMVESDSKEADAASWEFAQYWENNAALCGSVLVYNTGRSLGQFKHLLQDKSGQLAVPDVVVTAVGTKIFHLESRDQGRSNCNGTEWREDVRWAKILDEGWDLDAVRSIASDLIDNAGDEVNWLDYGIEHPHRIALSVRVDILDNIMNKLKEAFDKKDIQVQVICSGTGGWRYVDCVPINGGKLCALEYVRDVYRVPKERCVAAGDSCNDVLMLQGEHPAIIVGNAQEELQDWLLEQPQQDRVIFTDAPLARGILEGLSRHGLY